MVPGTHYSVDLYTFIHNTRPDEIHYNTFNIHLIKCSISLAHVWGRKGPQFLQISHGISEKQIYGFLRQYQSLIAFYNNYLG